MKIVFNVLRNLESGNLVYSRQLISELHQNHPDCEITVMANNKSSSIWNGYPGIKTRYFPFTGFLPLDLILESIYAYFYLWRKKPDIFHTTSTFIPLTPKNTNNVITVHDLNFNSLKFSKVKTFYKKLSLKHSLEKAQKVICISNFTNTEIANFYLQASSKTSVIWNGHNYQYTETEPSRKKYQILSFAHRTHKNAESSIKIIKMLKSEGYVFKLTIVGENEGYIKELKALTKELSLEEEVEFVGKVTDTELNQLYLKSSILLFLSKSEGFGLPALEAMANGCLVIASDIPPLMEIVQNYGACVPMNDLELAKNKILNLLKNNNEAEKMRKIAKKYAKEFTWTRCAKLTYDEYKKLI